MDNIINTLNESGPWIVGPATIILISTLIGLGKLILRKLGWGGGLVWDLWNKQIPVVIGFVMGLFGLASPDGVAPWAFYTVCGALSRHGYEWLFELLPKTKAKVKNSMSPPSA